MAHKWKYLTRGYGKEKMSSLQKAPKLLFRKTTHLKLCCLIPISTLNVTANQKGIIMAVNIFTLKLIGSSEIAAIIASSPSKTRAGPANNFCNHCHFNAICNLQSFHRVKQHSVRKHEKSNRKRKSRTKHSTRKV